MEEHSDLIDMSNDLSLSGRGERSVRGGGRGRGGRGGGGGGGRVEKREVQISKALSKLLRHDAEKEGLALDAEGFARVDQVVGSLFSFFYLLSWEVLSNWIFLFCRRFVHFTKTIS
jgi:hypothetical protein